MGTFTTSFLSIKNSKNFKHSEVDACGLPIATKSILLFPVLKFCHKFNKSIGIIDDEFAHLIFCNSSSGVCPFICIIGAADVVPNAAHNAFKPSLLIEISSRPDNNGIPLGDLCPANQPTIGQIASSKLVGSVT